MRKIFATSLLLVLSPLHGVVAENISPGAPLVIPDQRGICRTAEDSIAYFELRTEGKTPAEAVNSVNAGKTDAVCETHTGKIQYETIAWAGPYKTKSGQMFYIKKIHLQNSNGTWRQRFHTVAVLCDGIYPACPIHTPGLND